MSIAKYDSLLCPGQKVTEEQFETDRNLLEFEKVVRPFNRRNFLASFVAASAAAAAGTLMPRSAQAQSTTPSVTDVLNFALNFEYLEANFYLGAIGGTLSATDQGTSPGTISGGGPITFTDTATQMLAQALAADEVHHIEQLRATVTALGGTPISQPTINLAANGKVTTQAQFLAAARQFTALGGSAYIGGSQYLVSNPAVLTAAAQILGAEGYHDGAVNYQIVRQALSSLSPMIDAQDVVPTSSLYFTLFPATNAVTNTAMPPALAPSRTTSEVLAVVYGIATPMTTMAAVTGKTSGGFFPSGVNGNIKST